MKVDDLLNTIKSGAPELLHRSEAIFGRKPSQTMAKASKGYARKEDVEELLNIVRSLKGGTQEDMWQAAVRAAEIQERLDRTNSPDTIEDVVKRAGALAWDRRFRVNRGTPRERVEASEALEKNLLQRLTERRRHRVDIFGRRTGE